MRIGPTTKINMPSRLGARNNSAHKASPLRPRGRPREPPPFRERVLLVVRQQVLDVALYLRQAVGDAGLAQPHLAEALVEEVEELSEALERFGGDASLVGDDEHVVAGRVDVRGDEGVAQADAATRRDDDAGFRPAGLRLG